MRMEKRCIIRGIIRLIRGAAIIAGFGCLVCLTHRESAKIADKPIQKGIAAFEPNKDLIDFHATAYCITGLTKSGIEVAPGHVAADPKVIPLGSMIYVDSPIMGGIYQVLDTGELVKGKFIDIFIPSYERCREFGVRAVKVKILRHGFLGSPPEKKQGK
jgi:3D (Asp-Asp-Asp) domain-containing protein